MLFGEFGRIAAPLTAAIALVVLWMLPEEPSPRLSLPEMRDMVLEQDPAGLVVPWHDAVGKVSGTMTPGPAYRTTDGRTCRPFALTVEPAASEPQTGPVVPNRLTACRIGNGTWTVEDRPPQQSAQSPDTELDAAGW